MHREVFLAFFDRFKNLTPVQEKSIPLLSEGRNVIISAGTGTGKTEAVLAPLIDKYYDYAYKYNWLTWLYVTPTKALVNDIYRRIEPTLSRLDLRSGIRHGDRDDTRRVRATNLLITTPESLDVLLCRGDGLLRSLRALILDEVHLLYNTQRGLQLSLLISRLNKIITNPPLQVACLSATISSCEDIIHFFFGKSADFSTVSIPPQRPIDALIKTIRDEKEIIALFEKIMQKDTKFLVFANSRRECDRLSATLSGNKILSKHIFTHYSSISAQLREETERKFNEEKTGICIATSTLELGIDIGDIDATVLYGLPSTVSSFLQRIGRGNRRGTKSNVVCLIPQKAQSSILYALCFHALIELAKEGDIEKTRPMRLYGAMLQQALSFITSKKGAYTSVKELANISSAHEHLTEDAIDNILLFASTKNYVKKHEYKNKYGADEGLYHLIDYNLVYSNFPISYQEVSIYHDKKEIGSVPKFNLLRIKKNEVILFAGKYWLVEKVGRNGIFVKPEQTTSRDAKEIRYYTEGIGIDLKILNRTYEYLKGRNVDISLFGKRMGEMISNFLAEARIVFQDNTIPVIQKSNHFYHITFAGKLCNDIISKKLEIPDVVINNFSIVAPNIIDFSKLDAEPEKYEDIVGDLVDELIENDIFENYSSQTIFQSLLPKELQKKEFIEEWVRKIENRDVLERLKISKTRLIPYKAFNFTQSGIF